MTTGFVFHERFLWHDTGNQWMLPLGTATTQPLTHPESAESKRRFKNLLDATELSDALHHLKPRMASREEIERVHTSAYVDRIIEMSANFGGEGGEDCPFGPGSYEIALLSAGGAIMAVDAVLNGEVDNLYALLRPPGHHALPDKGYGFCIFSNIGVALRHAFQAHNLKRVAVIDWDVHHGNGTEAIFYEDPQVLTISIHQDRLFPVKTGKIEDNGVGAGLGYNLNIPLPAGSGHETYLATMEWIVLPALARYRPDLIVVASGLDASLFDPLGRMMATSETYRLMTRMLLASAQSLCQGRLVMCHEGGYSEAYVPYCGIAIIEEMCGQRTSHKDPFVPFGEALLPHALSPAQDAVIQAVEPLLARIG